MLSVAVLAMAGCIENENDAAAPPPRPVLSMIVVTDLDAQLGFAGTIEPRYTTDLGFQVGGNVTNFGVEVGDLVDEGQPLAQVDLIAFEEEVRSRQADLARAQSQSRNAEASERRTATLLSQSVASQAEADAAVEARDTAAANLRSVEANFAKALEDLRYATLSSDMAGVVTAKTGEVGQTVSAGQTVLTLARLDAREAVVDLPEATRRSIVKGSTFEIALQADTTQRARGKVREIAPQADAGTRQHRVRITLDDVPDAFRIGATITVFPLAPARPEALEIPRSAVLERDGGARVWLVDAKGTHVRTKAVEIVGEIAGEDVQVSKGLAPGDRVVVAGVRSLTEGQAVTLDARAAE